MDSQVRRYQPADEDSIVAIAEIDEELIQSYFGTVSLPFRAGQHKRAAVKIIDDRGIESLKLISLE